MFSRLTVEMFVCGNGFTGCTKMRAPSQGRPRVSAAILSGLTSS